MLATIANGVSHVNREGRSRAQVVRRVADRIEQARTPGVPGRLCPGSAAPTRDSHDTGWSAGVQTGMDPTVDRVALLTGRGPSAVLSVNSKRAPHGPRELRATCSMYTLSVCSQV